MASMPLVSILIPCYNHESYVQECITSVINQDYENIELIIIDDGSSDNSVKKIKEMIPACEKRFVRFSFRTRGNKGLSATLNEAIEWCTGIYFSGVASDDVLLPQKTSTLLKHIDGEEGLSGVFCGCYYTDDYGKIIGVNRVAKDDYSFEDIILRKRHVCTATQLLRLESIKQVGGYKNDLYIEDFYMWLALTENGNKLRVVDSLLVNYRQHKGSAKSIFKMHEGRIKVLEFFSKNNLYKKAMAINCLIASYYVSSTSKIKATEYIIDGIGYNIRILLSIRFLKCFLRIIIPRYDTLLAKLKHLPPGMSKN